MNKVINIYDVKTNLSKYIKQAKSGHPVYIGSYGKREVVLMAVQPDEKAVKFGTAAGKFEFYESALEGIDGDTQKLFYGEK